MSLTIAPLTNPPAKRTPGVDGNLLRVEGSWILVVDLLASDPIPSEASECRCSVRLVKSMIRLEFWTH